MTDNYSIWHLSLCLLPRRKQNSPNDILIQVYRPRLSFCLHVLLKYLQCSVIQNHLRSRWTETIKDKHCFCRASNGIFAKVGRLTSEDVVVQLLKHKHLPILLYALEVCNLDRRTIQSLDFTLNSFLMKLIETSNLEIVRHCQSVFGCELPSVLLSERYGKFSEVCLLIIS